MKRGLSTIAMALMFLSMQGQSAEMADVMRENGKIYVVVGVVALIFLVLFIYLIYLDLRLKKAEKDLKEE